MQTKFRVGGGMALVLFAVGCNHTPIIRDHGKLPTDRPDAASLVHYLNTNAKKAQSIRCKVDIDAKQGKQAIGLGGLMACRQPRDFRIKANVVGQPAADLGSNDRELWFWVSKSPEPYVFHCDHADLEGGKIKLPFPIQPEIVLAALNMAEYDPNGKYEIRTHPRTMELVQDAKAPNGQTVKRITVFDRQVAASGKPQVLGHVLADEKGKLICKATVQSVTVDRGSGAVVPTSVTIEWPAQELAMKLMLSDVNVNVVDKDMAAAVFSRGDLSKIPSVNLATGKMTKAAGLQRAEGPGKTR